MLLTRKVVERRTNKFEEKAGLNVHLLNLVAVIPLRSYRSEFQLLSADILQQCRRLACQQCASKPSIYGHIVASVANVYSGLS